MPGPDDSSYMLAITAHHGVGSAAEARELLKFLGRVNWQPPEDALMLLLALACAEPAGGGDPARGSVGAAHRPRPVPSPWRDFMLRGTLPQGVSCLRYLVDAATSDHTGAVPESPSRQQRLEYAWVC